ncbi:MAG: hypothetical protein LUD46_05135 [Parabacteroides sp.]|nr:hypothetical protein [Parabacteroides sp.]
MKTIIRNLLGIVRRFKMAMLLNVMGLSVAFAAFIILMIQLQYDWGFDRYQKNAKQIFRVGLYIQSWGNQVVVSRPFANTFLHSSPHIEKAALISGFPGQLPLKAEGRDKEGKASIALLVQLLRNTLLSSTSRCWRVVPKVWIIRVRY